jgi:hypothetical protein
VFCRTSRIKTYSADKHKNRSDPDQDRRPFLLVAGLLRGNWAIDCRLCRGCLSARERRKGIASSWRRDGLSEWAFSLVELCKAGLARLRQALRGFLYLLDDLLGHRLFLCLIDRTKGEQKDHHPEHNKDVPFHVCSLPTAQAERKQGEVCACSLEGQRHPHRFGDYVPS